MSLVQHLSGDLGALLRQRLPALDGLVDDTAQRVRQASNARPPAAGGGGRLPGSHFAQVGSIVGQILADDIEPAPPYAALSGAVRCDGLSWPLAAQLAAEYPTHREHREQTLQAPVGRLPRPTPTGWWYGAAGSREPEAARGEGALPDLLGQHAGLLGSRARLHQDRLDLYLLISRLEDIYRGHDQVADLQRIADTGRAEVPEAIATDVRSVLEHTQPAMQRAERLVSSERRTGRLGHAAPVLVPSWAEGDVLLGPHPADGSYTLLDIKCTMRPEAERIRTWLTQVTAYALLDDVDRWRIRRVGLLLPRQSLLVGWRLDAVLHGSRGHDLLQQEFLAHARAAAEADGAHLATARR